MMNTMPAELPDIKEAKGGSGYLHRNGSFQQPRADFELEPRLVRFKQAVRNGFYREFRGLEQLDVFSECDSENLSWPRRVARLTRRLCEAQRPVVVPDERIVFTRTTRAVPLIYRPSQWQALTHGRTMHEGGVISNVCANWEMLLSQGLLGRRRVALATRERLKQNPEAVEFLDCAVETIDAVLDLARRYAAEASRRSRRGLVEILERVPAFPARSFQEALQAIRICHAVLWLGGHYHCGLGRFDQYMWPYLEKDLACGRLNINSAGQLLAEFFLSLNRDSDLYPGIQQGDNGQSLMLGGVRRDGTDAVNPLTYLVLRVARGVGMIDPKINLRVTRDTPLELLTVAAKLTEIGLGFPQYSNDDVVIPGLVAHGYDLEDARDYSVAACWEFIVPGSGMEVVNVGAVSMPAAVDQAIRSGLAAGDSFGKILTRVGTNLQSQVERLAERSARLLLPPAPYHSVLMDGCLERGFDMSNGLKYNNVGIHGACSSNAADALAAVKHFVFDERSMSAQSLLNALNTNFEQDETLRRRLFDEAPKVGNHDPRAGRPRSSRRSRRSARSRRSGAGTGAGAGPGRAGRR